MPTLIGRFNELLHHLSTSSSSSSSTSPSVTATVPPGTTRNPPVRSHSNRTNSRPSTDRVAVVRRSSSSSRSKPPVVGSSSSSSSSGRKTEEGHHHHNRSRHRSSSSSQSRQSSGSGRRESVTRRESINGTTHSHHSTSRRAQHMVSSSANGTRRRHSIASVTSIPAISSSTITTTSGGKKKSTSVANNTTTTTGKKSKGALAEKNNNHHHELQQQANGDHRLAHNNNNNNNELGKAHNAAKLTVMTSSVDSESDESLASKLARKMKISAITRKGSNGSGASSQTSNTNKKLAKLTKKNSSDTDSDPESKGSFIYRYLNGHLTKSHPDIKSGKTCDDLPIKDIETLERAVMAACTGPTDGLLHVQAASLSKPFELAFDDVDFIDEDYPDSSLSSTGSSHGHLSPSPRCGGDGKQLNSKLSTSSVSSDAGELATSSDENGSPSSWDKSPVPPSSQSPEGNEAVAGITDWQRATDFAYGISTTLYESLPTTKRNAGDPIADSFAVCVRENSAILALADGVNWGEKACLASRCAVHGCVDYLNKALYASGESTRVRNTLDIFVALLRSFNAAHNLILAQGGHLTTLCAAVVCQLKNSDRFIVCTCNVGDSLAYVYSASHGVREITQGSHDIFSMRDMRDALGALGPVSGSEPELNNLTVAMTVVDVGDIIFLTSDGISDNFDPVVGKFAMPRRGQPQAGAVAPKATPEVESVEAAAVSNGKSKHAEGKSSSKSKTKARKSVQRSNSNPESASAARRNVLNPANYTSRGLPLVTAQQRHELSLLRMEDLITNGVNGASDSCKGPQKVHKSARELCSLMVEFSTKLTMAKRRILEDPELYSDNDGEQDLQGGEAFEKQRRRRRLVSQKLAQVPGKLDHASIAAVEVGFYGSLAAKRAAAYRSHLVHQSFSPKRLHLQTKSSHSDEATRLLQLGPRATLARFESQDSLECCSEAGPI